MQVSESTAEPFVPSRGGLRALRDAARDCRGCDLYKSATQTVFGSGPSRARLLFVGEQPGDREDIEGEPFVGPAGGLLDRALAEAGIERGDAYLTNAVKHFKFVPQDRGKRRIHKKPSTTEMRACRPWLVAELRVVRPEIVVCLGATAAQALMGGDFRISRERGVLLDFPEIAGVEPRPVSLLATTHPSAVVRAPDRREAYRGLVSDLEVVAAALGS
ncbi:UdgX family uracil-DNA binding protein [Saccharopolyspora erythraea]|uniref:UdgX family uracil-DNA binding protein n=1 Tax=Saccharopolyspora erythraea TaxID=1836 RepID=UPI001BABF67E|nr:UdgX family uracil-DNA binding protein [Saccharopolyspora erythraea]QUH02446.1 UdgX family uracil-DNA binding protein [Saccharopolyspora erythraea]